MVLSGSEDSQSVLELLRIHCIHIVYTVYMS